MRESACDKGARYGYFGFMMKLDGAFGLDIAADSDTARRIESAGFVTGWLGETKHDPFLRSLLALEATTTLNVGTAVAIAFGRSPLTVAMSAYDLAGLGKGRYLLGLGSQVKGHIERRYSMPWGRPAARMREFVGAVRAIWASWENDTELSFEGDFYHHTLMPPFFRPPAHEYGPPPIYVAAVGEYMTRVAGEVADGMLFHPFMTQLYLESAVIPALRRGRERSDRSDEPELHGVAMAAVGRTDDEVDAAIAAVRNEIAFYSSTPAYRPVLEVHGWGDVAEAVYPLSKSGRWDEMAPFVTDEMVETFAVVGKPDNVARQLEARFGATTDSVWLSMPYEHTLDLEAEVLSALSTPHAAQEVR